MKFPRLKGYQWLMLGMGLLLMLLTMLELNSNHQPDWKPGFERRSREPLGTLGFYKQIEKMRGSDGWETRDEPITEYYERFYLNLDDETATEIEAVPDELESFEAEESTDELTDDETTTNTETPEAYSLQPFPPDEDRKVLLFINDRLEFDKYEMAILLGMVKSGDVVFLSASSFSWEMLDTLGIEQKYMFSGFDLKNRETVHLGDSIHFRPRSHNLLKLRYTTAFQIIDSINNVELGFNEEANTNLIICRYGKGYFLVHGQPTAFTNVNFADGPNYRYAFQVVGYLPWQGTWIWDDYYKSGRLMVRSPLRYIFRTPALRFAWYILLAAGLLFMLFYGKRRQRIIPIVKPPENSSLEFAEVMGSFYRHNGNHADIIRKKMVFFADFIQKHYMLYYKPEHPDFAELLGKKSGVNPKLIKRIVNCDIYARKHSDVSEQFLMDVNDLLERFYDETQKLTPNKQEK